MPVYIAKTPKQRGENSATYYAVTSTPSVIDSIGAEEWDALPASRLKDVCGRIYTAANIDDANAQMGEYLASEGFSAVVQGIGGNAIPTELALNTVGLNQYRLFIPYESLGAGIPVIVRISLSYSASE